MSFLSMNSTNGQELSSVPVKTDMSFFSTKSTGWRILSSILTAAFFVCSLIAVLEIEDQRALGICVLTIAGLAYAAPKLGILQGAEEAGAYHPWSVRCIIAIASVSVLLTLKENNFALLMLATILIYASVCLGLTIQTGYTGIFNFAGAAFLGTGGYTAAMLGNVTWLPDAAVIVLGGLIAAALGTVLILPVLRTRGHYAALTTLAFGILFNGFLEANELLGGPQGLKVPGIQILGWDFSNDLSVGGITFSFYANYLLLIGAIFALFMTFIRFLERSWIGIWLDAVRLDETAASVFGLRVSIWKSFAFTAGNFLAGLMGVVYAKMIAFIAPANFTFGDSLILVSIVLLGGIGNRWGVLIATVIVVLLPEKLQFIQEYRLLLFACVIICLLMVRPAGLLARRVRVLGRL
jgi:ABC-type branched-subunit amino acid transport system permease subunit